MSQANVRSIDALEELERSLVRHAEQTLATLAAVQREMQRTFEWLEERQRYWRQQVVACTEAVRAAKAAYAACRNQTDRDGHAPNCSAQAEAVAIAERRLAAAEHEAQMVAYAYKAVEAESTQYSREARQLQGLLVNETPKAVGTLRYKVTVLRNYGSGGGLSAALAAGVVGFGAGLLAGSLLGNAARDAEASSPAETAGVQPGGANRERSIQEAHPDIHDVLIGQIDLSDSTVQGEGDFHKIPKAQMVAGLERFTQVRQWISQGVTSEQLREIDQQAGLEGNLSHFNLYQVFYGDSAIAVARVGEGYEVINGYHRLAVARDLGWRTIPVRIVGEAGGDSA